jgi:drug/metabolite transporter (DMT)-like permease
MSATMIDAPDREGLAPFAAYGAICLIWGSTFYAIRLAVETIPPWTAMGMRSLISGAILFAVARSGGARMPGARGFASAAVAGALLFLVCHGLLAWAEMRVASSASALLGCTVSLLTPLAAWSMGASRRPSALAGIGLLLGFGGVFVLADPRGGMSGMGCVALMVGNVGWALGAAVARRWPSASSAMLGSALQLLIGGAMCLAAAGLRGEWSAGILAQVSARSVLGLGYLIVFGSLIAFASYGWLNQVWRPERVSTYAYVNPLVALAIGVGLAGEHFGLRELVASICILGAVMLVMLGPTLNIRKFFGAFFQKRTASS